jgi:threonine dehydrogenase-like Zn-dependent dehydrogenase
MKFCKTCDLYIDRNVNYCGECGTKLTEVDMSAATAISPDFKQNAFTHKENTTYPDFYDNEYYFGHVKKFSSNEIKRKRGSKVVVEKNRICGNCNKTFHTKDLTQCGPCGNFFVIIVGKIIVGVMEKHQQ